MSVIRLALSCVYNLLRQKFSKMPLVPLNSIANNSMDDKFLTRMNEIIEENFSNPELSVDFLAEKLCISRSGLFAKIKTLANITPNELIQVVRLKKAARKERLDHGGAGGRSAEAGILHGLALGLVFQLLAGGFHCREQAAFGMQRAGARLLFHEVAAAYREHALIFSTWPL